MKKTTCIGEFAVAEMGNGVFSLSLSPFGFRQYLILGSEKALLVDTGFGFRSLKKVVDSLTKLPIILVNTHGHPDHSGGNAEFGAPFLHPLDNEVYDIKCSLAARIKEASDDMGVKNAEQLLQPEPPKPKKMQDGEVFQLGGRTLRVLHTPGHTRGSVCLLDSKTGMLFSGDTVQNTPTALLGKYATRVSEYVASLKKLKEFEITAICPGHRDNQLPVDLIDRKIRCAHRILEGDQGERIQSREGPAFRLTFEGTAVEYTLDNLG